MVLHERRQEERVPSDFLANKVVDGVPHLCRVLNVSRNGVMVERMGGPTRHPREIRLDLLFPGQQRPFYCDGEIVHQKEDMMGIRFTDLTTEQQEVIEEFVAGQR